MKTDQFDRPVMVMHEVRSALQTTDATLTTGTAVTLIAADADYFTDILEVTASNNSNVAAQVSITNDGTTVRNLIIPAGSTIQLSFDAPLKQGVRNTTWLADMEDITGTTVVVHGTWIKNKN